MQDPSKSEFGFGDGLMGGASASMPAFGSAMGGADNVSGGPLTTFGSPEGSQEPVGWVSMSDE
eukprot:2966758-Rhodomonas_salina.3